MASDENLTQRLCANCGLANPATNRFCGNCGGALADARSIERTQPLTVPSAADSVERTLPLPVAAATAGEPTQPLPQVVTDPTEPMATALPAGENAAAAWLPKPVDTPRVMPPGSGSRPPAVNAPINAGASPALRTAAQQSAATPPKAAETALTGIARERERDRLLTLANVQRMRDQSTEARKTLEQALTLMEGRPGSEVAPIYELVGDLYDAEAHWDDARKAYSKAHELDPQRASAERKFAALTLRVAEVMPGNSLAQAVLRGDSIADLLATGALASERGRRNAGVAMLLSAAIPGFGQFYNGEIVKGSVILTTYAATLLYFTLSPDHEVFVHKFAAIVALSRSHAANASVSPLSVFIGVLMVAVWLYAIVDAPFMAAKTPHSGGGGGVSGIDKSGWEV